MFCKQFRYRGVCVSLIKTYTHVHISKSFNGYTFTQVHKNSYLSTQQYLYVQALQVFFDVHRVAKSSYNVSDFRWSYKRSRREGGDVMRLGVPNSWGNLAPTRTPRPANHIRRKTPCPLNSHPHPNTTNLWQRCTRTPLPITSPPLLQVSWCQVLFCHLQVVETSDKIYHVKV